MTLVTWSSNNLALYYSIWYSLKMPFWHVASTWHFPSLWAHRRFLCELCVYVREKRRRQKKIKNFNVIKRKQFFHKKNKNWEVWMYEENGWVENEERKNKHNFWADLMALRNLTSYFSCRLLWFSAFKHVIIWYFLLFCCSRECERLIFF